AFWPQSLPVAARIFPEVPPDNNNWAPRLGFVYSPKFTSGLLGKAFGDGRSTVRGGYGIAYEASFYNLLLNISTASPLVFLTTATIGVPDANPTGDKVRAAAGAAGAIRFNAFDRRL